MERNLSAAMGGRFPTVKEQKAIVRRAWRNFAQGINETTYSTFTSGKALRSDVLIQGEEHVRQALGKGKGAIALSAHLGNFTLIGPRLAVEGYPFSAVVKHPRDERLTLLLDSYRAGMGVGTISARPRRQATRQILRALRANGLVLMIADEFKSSGVEVEFLGRSSLAPRGPVSLALRTGAPIVPMFMIRDREDRLTLHIEREVELVQTGNSQEDVSFNVGAVTRLLETMVCRYPDQWSWLGFRDDRKNPGEKGLRKKRGSSRMRVHTQKHETAIQEKDGAMPMEGYDR
jgi:KDO2-lipid IV(A) lauroyltransferase